ncbi:hypothetical protein [Schlesneria sp. T3-172]|uniref:hypothetical protein n=1 Tax=Schlesneria sphaerica TaxID=3373610 RepID=UPI0037C61DC2
MSNYRVEVFLQSPENPAEHVRVITLCGKYLNSGDAQQAAMRAIHLPGQYILKVFKIDHVVSLTYSLEPTV